MEIRREQALKRTSYGAYSPSVPSAHPVRCWSLPLASSSENPSPSLYLLGIHYSEKETATDPATLACYAGREYCDVRVLMTWLERKSSR